MKIAIFHIGHVDDPQVAEMRTTLEQTGWHQRNIIEVIVPGPRNPALLRLATVLEDHPDVLVLYSSIDGLFVDGSVESATLYNVCVNQEVGIQTAETIVPVSQFPQPIVSSLPDLEEQSTAGAGFAQPGDSGEITLASGINTTDESES